jgi:hypothetical protein
MAIQDSVFARAGVARFAAEAREWLVNAAKIRKDPNDLAICPLRRRIAECGLIAWLGAWLSVANAYT